MEITPQCVVALTWTLKDTLGEVLDTLDEAVEFFVGGDDLLEKLQTALQGATPGTTLDLHLEPEDAFGDFNEQLIFLEPRHIFPPELEEGLVFDGHSLPIGFSSSAPKHAIYVVTDIYPEHVVLDANHPLAGIAIRLSLRVESVRQPTPLEVSRLSCGTGFFKIPSEQHSEMAQPSLNQPGDGKTHH